jgi:hypothetical protein
MAISARGLKPHAILGAAKPHGTRLRYMSGCKCAACRRANSLYECERARARKAGDWNGIVSAEAARAHILKLRRAGVRRRAIAAASDVREQTIQEVAAGRKRRLRARAERRILTVSKAMRSDGSLVAAVRTWKLIGLILEEGYTKAWVAKQLGNETPALQLNKRLVTARNAENVERLYRRIST